MQSTVVSRASLARTSDRLDHRAAHRRAMRGTTAAERAATNVIAVRSARRRGVASDRSDVRPTHVILVRSTGVGEIATIRRVPLAQADQVARHGARNFGASLVQIGSLWHTRARRAAVPERVSRPRQNHAAVGQRFSWNPTGVAPVGLVFRAMLGGLSPQACPGSARGRLPPPGCWVVNWAV